MKIHIIKTSLIASTLVLLLNYIPDLHAEQPLGLMIVNQITESLVNDTMAQAPMMQNNKIIIQRTHHNSNKHPDLSQNNSDTNNTKKIQITSVNESASNKTVWFSSSGTINLFNQNYVMPFYYTASPDQTIYTGNTPNNQQIKSEEIKSQLSLEIPLVYIYNNKFRFNLAYTQLSYWQFYAESQYFRETNYMPELFMETDIMKDVTASIGIVHESNGRGGDLERSWNRAYIQSVYNNQIFMVGIKAWDLIFRSSSSDLHNSDIANYLGYGELNLGYQVHKNYLSLMFRSFKHPTLELNWSFPIYGVLDGYVQFFSGYGQSLIEYNHHTNAVGVGLSINNW